MWWERLPSAAVRRVPGVLPALCHRAAVSQPSAPVLVGSAQAHGRMGTGIPACIGFGPLLIQRQLQMPMTEADEALSMFQAVIQGFRWINLLVLTAAPQGWDFYQAHSADPVHGHPETESVSQSTSLPPERVAWPWRRVGFCWRKLTRTGEEAQGTLWVDQGDSQMTRLCNI